MLAARMEGIGRLDGDFRETSALESPPAEEPGRKVRSPQSRNGSWRVLFRYGGKQHTFLLGEVKEREAETVCAKVDYWLMRLKQKLVQLPAGCDIVTFVQHDGKPPARAAADAVERQELTLGDLRQVYIASQENKQEETSLRGIKLHFGHLERILGVDRLIPSLQRPDLQKYVDTRSKEWIDPNIYRKARRAKQAAAKPKRKYKRKTPPAPEPADKPKRHPSASTIKKEIVSLRTAWSWARRHLGLREEFPGGGLDYPKMEESLPFMTWDEAEHRIRSTEQRLAGHAGVLGVVADHAATEEKSVMQGRVAEEPPLPPAGETFARQAQRVADRCAKDHAGELVETVRLHLHRRIRVSHGSLSRGRQPATSPASEGSLITNFHIPSTLPSARAGEQDGRELSSSPSAHLAAQQCTPLIGLDDLLDRTLAAADRDGCRGQAKSTGAIRS